MKGNRAPGFAKEILAENLKNIRKSMGYNQVDFAHKIGIKQAELSQIEAGKRGFSPEGLDSIAAALGCAPWELLKPGVDFVPPDLPGAAPPPSSALSKSAATGRLLTSDFVAVLARLEAIQHSEPDRLLATIAILFDDDSLAPADLDFLTPLRAHAKPG